MRKVYAARKLGSNAVDIRATYELAAQHQRRGHVPEAEVLYRQILARSPGEAPAIYQLGILAHTAGRPNEAVSLLQRATEANPYAMEYLINYGIALASRGAMDQAEDALRRAVALRCDIPEAYYSLATVLRAKGEVQDALRFCRRYLDLRPDDSEVRHILAGLLLSIGDFEEGWDAYESRWELAGRSRDRGLSQPLWEGSDLSDRSILLHTEQGYGDSIQFARYLEMVSARTKIVACRPELRRLLHGRFGIDQIITPGDPLPRFDVHCALGSLPRIFHTRSETIPARIPYLCADAREIEQWTRRMRAQAGLRVGLVWAGSPSHRNDVRRSVSLQTIAPLADVSDVQFYSLQKGEAAKVASRMRAASRMTDWTAELRDFADTAALISALDLVITVDTAVAHLAGSLGSRVWVMLPFEADWRWLLQREDSPWYPTMRLFRQKSPGGWDDVVARVVAELAHVASGREALNGQANSSADSKD